MQIRWNSALTVNDRKTSKNFTFCIPKYQIEKYNNEDISFNSKTLSPRNIFNKNLYEKNFGMYVKVNPRIIMSKI